MCGAIRSRYGSPPDTTRTAFERFGFATASAALRSGGAGIGFERSCAWRATSAGTSSGHTIPRPSSPTIAKMLDQGTTQKNGI